MKAARLVALLSRAQVVSELSDDAWLELFEQACQCRLELVVGDKFASVMPPSVSPQWSEELMSQTLQNLARCRELVEVLDFLEADGIHALAYKGPTLAALAHGSPTLRTFDDLDLWVSPEQYRAAACCLQNAGYQFAGHPVPRCHLIQAFETTLIHPERRVSVDLHRSFLPPSIPVRDEVLSEYLQQVTILGRQITTLSNEALLVLLLAHGSKHAWREIRWLYDVHCLLESQDMDWTLIYELALESGCLRSCQVGLHLTDVLFATRQISELFWPDAVARQLARRSLGFLSNERPTLGELQSYHWALCPTLRSKARYLFYTILAPHELDLAWVDLPENLYRLYYLLRPIRKAGSLLSK